MNRLSVRLLVSHVLVAVIGGLTAYVLVRLVAPAMFDHDVEMMSGGGMHGAGNGAVGATFRSAINNALLVGILAGVAAAATAGAYAAHRIQRPLERVRAATRRLAAGHYDEQVPRPEEVELAALADDVNTLAGALADTEVRRVRLLSEVAHEMRTPLTVVDGYVEGLIDGVLPPDEETLGEIGTEVRRLRRLADDLSELSRAEERRLDVSLEDLDLAALTEQASERLRPQFDDAGLRLTVATAPAPLPVRGDADRLGQVVTNLLGNAIKATPRGGAVRVQTGRHDGRAFTRVTDTGVGLSAEDLSRVFERFYRVSSPGEPQQGSGIGLTIARGIARAHGGDVTATSPGPGLGAAFTMDLPAHD